MREFHPDLSASLASGATTLCRCARLQRADGQVFGFTDHDAALEFEGLTYEPCDGFEASQESAALGPATGEWDLKAALSDERITQADLIAGKYDGAQIETFLADWQNPAIFERLSAGTLGEVTSRDGVFHAEVRGPFAAHNRKRGRVFAARCDAELGDARCGVNLDTAQLQCMRSVQSVVQPNVLLLSDMSAFDASHFDGGTLVRGTDAAIRVRAHRVDGAIAEITLWHAPVTPFAVGDSITLTAGCDKSFATCTAKFGNGTNFRGFPFMPGDDFALSYPSSADGNLDGRSLRS
ncbi:MAG: DUF2163 domain-containing protein [Devosiaceae bacterium]